MTRALLVTCALVLAASPARADDPPPSAVDVKEARKHFQAGKRLIDQKHFAEAIGELEQAYQLDPQDEHLYNLGVAHHLNGDLDDAIAYYRLFLESGPAGKTAQNAARYLQALEDQAAQKLADAHAKAAEEDAKRLAALPPVVDNAAADELARLADAAELRAKELQAELDALTAEETTFRTALAADEQRRDHARKLAKRWERDARDAPSGDGGGRRLAGNILLGVGAATLTFSALDVLNGNDQLSDRGMPSLMLPVGALAFVGGLGLYVSGEIAVGSPRDASTFRQVVIAPAAGRDSFQVVMSARF
jgi:tetratricopeptide (TPR) repeat protein